VEVTATPAGIENFKPTQIADILIFFKFGLSPKCGCVAWVTHGEIFIKKEFN